MLIVLPGCIFLSLTETNPIPVELDWPATFDQWIECAERKNVPLWSAATYRPGKGREKGETENNVESVSAVVLDFDGKGDNVTIDVALAVIPEVEVAAHTTHRHVPEKPRFRVIFPLSRLVSTDEYRRIWAWVQRTYLAAGISFDALSDPGRIFFLPSHKAGAPYTYTYRRGPLLNVEETLRLAGDVPLPPTRARPAAPAPSRPFAASASTSASTSIFAGIETAHQTENLERIEEQCAFMRHCREDAQTLPEPEWYAWLSILARCRDGESRAHEIGSAHPGYTAAETSDKFRRAMTETGPRTCSAIREMCSACEGCPLGAPVGNITSPVMLGRPDPETATVEELREDQVARSEGDVERAQAAVAAAEARITALQVEENVIRARLSNARRFGSEDNIRAESEAHARIQNDLRTARGQRRDAESALRAAESRARRTVTLTTADPRVLNTLMLDPRTGVPRASLGNVENILRNDGTYNGAYFRYDEFSQKLFYGQERAADHIDTDINLDIERRYNLSSRTQIVQEAIVSIARSNSFHPVRDYLDGLTWDGTGRLDAMFEQGFGATGSSVFLSEAGVKFAIGAVARIYDPGCKMDTMVVLVGSQGARKSTGLRVLANGWFADSAIPIGDKDSYMLLAGKWIYEIGEMDSFRKAENTRIKAFLSSQVDYFRPPFGRHTIECPRQTVLVGSTNEDQFLNDPTGSRRFVPVRVTQVDVDWLKVHRDQLWAEAVVRYRAGEIFWYENESAERLAQESQPFQQDDVWSPTVYEYVVRRKVTQISVFDVLTGGLGIEVSRATRSDKNRVMHILKHFGCTLHSDTTSKGTLFNVPESMHGVTLMEKPEPKPHPLPRWASEKPAAAPSTPHPEGPLY
jgi:hypothetical protein